MFVVCQATLVTGQAQLFIDKASAAISAIIGMDFESDLAVERGFSPSFVHGAICQQSIDIRKLACQCELAIIEHDFHAIDDIVASGTRCTGQLETANILTLFALCRECD